MRSASALLSLCIAALSLGVKGNEVDATYIFAAFICIAMFLVLLQREDVVRVDSTAKGAVYLSSIFLLYASISSLLTWSVNIDYLSVVVTLPFLLLPLSFLVFWVLGLAREDWDRISVERVCVHAALIFCAVLIVGNPSAFLSSLLEGARFTWTEFRAVTPLPAIASALLIWRYGFKVVLRWEFWLLATYIYATKYINWLVLLAFALPLRYIALKFPRLWLSAILVMCIVVIDTLIFINWREAVTFAPTEFERIIELRIAYEAFMEQPLFGMGFGQFFADGSYSIHNLLAYVLSSGGGIGLVLFCPLIVLYSRIQGARSEFIVVVYLILTATAASYKLPSIQFCIGMALAAFAAPARLDVRPGVSRSPGPLHISSSFDRPS